MSCLAAAGLALAVACAPTPEEDVAFGQSAATEMDGCDGLGDLPADPRLSRAERNGRCTWNLWTAGTEKLYRHLAIETKGKFDLFTLLWATPRAERFSTYGAINDPGCTAATAPDENGLWLDRCSDPKSTGIVGLRKIPNPRFDRAEWSLAKYEKDRTIEPPFLVGATCGMCHVGFNPTKPPTDPASPAWDNLLPTIGNQYLREGKIFARSVDPKDFRWQVLSTQEPGTSDTSRIATDHINNPNAINAIFNLGGRMTHAEVMNDGTTRDVHHILKDGADSVGIAGASLRVYVNIGMCSEQYLDRHDAIKGEKDQKPLDPAKLREDCPDYVATEARMEDAAAFLMTQKTPRLQDAPTGAGRVTSDAVVLEQGKKVFAQSCASCHSSKQPPPGLDPAARASWFEASVLAPDFLADNYLSDDVRYPVTELQTNAARALGTNAKKGHLWQYYSSRTYKELPSPGKLSLYNPFDESEPIDFEVPGGGTGYYRTPSLTAIWATAPFLHNNALGTYNGDPSVDGRLVAFDDAIGKLLWPARRLGPASIKRTSAESELEMPVKLPGILPNFNLASIKVSAGTPVNLLANLDPRAFKVKLQMGKIALGHDDPNDAGRAQKLLDLSQCPDLVEDGGHLYGTTLDDASKLALIEFLKTM